MLIYIPSMNLVSCKACHHLSCPSWWVMHILCVLWINAGRPVEYSGSNRYADDLHWETRLHCKLVTCVGSSCSVFSQLTACIHTDCLYTYKICSEIQETYCEHDYVASCMYALHIRCVQNLEDCCHFLNNRLASWLHMYKNNCPIEMCSKCAWEIYIYCTCQTR